MRLNVIRWPLIILTILLLSADLNWHQNNIIHYYQQQPDLTLVNQAAALQYPPAMLQACQLSAACQGDQQLAYLSQAALANEPTAHLVLAQRYRQQQQVDAAERWFKSTIRLKYPPGAWRYVEFLIDQQRYEQARQILTLPWLQAIPSTATQRKYWSIELQLRQKPMAEAITALQQLSDQGFGLAQSRLAQLQNDLQWLGLEPLQPNSQPQRCDVTIQWLVADYQSLTKAKQLTAQWQQPSKDNPLVSCFKPVMLFDPADYGCIGQAGQRMSCDITRLASASQWPDGVLPVLIYATEGIANYHNGLVYLNGQSDFGVFRHEIFHHFGFIDEYELDSAIAEPLCRTDEIIAVGENLTIVPQLALTNGDWQRYQQQHQQQYQQPFVPVATCGSLPAVAFKSVKPLTNMAYMDQPMPSQYYRKALASLRQNPDQIMNYQYGFALAFWQKGDLDGYQHWLQRSAEQGYGYAKRSLQAATKPSHKSSPKP